MFFELNIDHCPDRPHLGSCRSAQPCCDLVGLLHSVQRTNWLVVRRDTLVRYHSESEIGQRDRSLSRLGGFQSRRQDCVCRDHP